MTSFMRQNLYLALSGIALLSACSQEPAPSAPPVEGATTPTPLSRLAPGQRVPATMAIGRQYAYMLVEITENDDAVSGTMAIEIDGQSAEACQDEFDTGPWLTLCQEAASQGGAIRLELPVEFARSTVTRGDSIVMAGAYGSFSSETLPAPLHIGYVMLDGGDMLLIERDGPAKDAPVASRFKMSDSDNDASNIDNARLLIAERRR